MKDLTCPYCQHKQDADDIHEEEVTHEVECHGCGMIYGVRTEYFPSYTESVMPCANGGDHEWEKIRSTSPVINGRGRWRCKHCDEEKMEPSQCSEGCKLDKKTCWHCSEAKT